MNCSIMNKSNSVNTQTDDTGCHNDCNSMYADIEKTKLPHYQQQQQQQGTTEQPHVLCSTNCTDPVVDDQVYEIQNWIEYRCKAGEVLFYYNKITSEHRYPEWNAVLKVGHCKAFTCTFEEIGLK